MEEVSQLLAVQRLLCFLSCDANEERWKDDIINDSAAGNLEG